MEPVMFPLVVLLLGSLGTSATVPPAVAVRQWTFLEWEWPNSTQQEQYMSSLNYQHNIPVGVSVDKITGSLFVTVPRFVGNGAIPATVARVLDAVGPNQQPLLRPFPSFEANDPDAQGGLRSSLGMTIDPFGRMWILDNGRVGSVTLNPQLVVYTGLGIGDTPSLLRRHLFPPSVAPLETAFLNDLAIDVSRGFVYITDSSDPAQGQKSGLIVYDYGADASWRVLSLADSTLAVPSVHISINQIPLDPMPLGPQAGADGISLTPDGQTLYWCPLTSRSLYSVETSLLRVQNAAVDPALVKTVLSRSFSSDGISFDFRGRLFMGSLDNSSIEVVDFSSNPPSLSTLVSNDSQMQWPDTVSFDHQGSFIFVSNGPSHFSPMNFSAVNYRIWSVQGAQTDSYMANMTDGIGGGDDDGGDDDGHSSAFAAVVFLTIFGVLSFMGAFISVWWRYRGNRKQSSEIETQPVMDESTAPYDELVENEY